MFVYIYICSKKDRFSSCAGFRLPGWAARQSGAGNAKLVALKGLFGCHYLIIMKTIIPPRQARETGIGQSRTKRGVSPGCLRAARGGWRRRHGEHNRRCDRYFFGVFFPSVCPEPVLVNRSFLVPNGSNRDAFFLRMQAPVRSCGVRTRARRAPAQRNHLLVCIHARF